MTTGVAHLVADADLEQVHEAFVVARVYGVAHLVADAPLDHVQVAFVVARVDGVVAGHWLFRSLD